MTQQAITERPLQGKKVGLLEPWEPPIGVLNTHSGSTRQQKVESCRIADTLPLSSPCLSPWEERQPFPPTVSKPPQGETPPLSLPSLMSAEKLGTEIIVQPFSDMWYLGVTTAQLISHLEVMWCNLVLHFHQEGASKSQVEEHSSTGLLHRRQCEGHFRQGPASEAQLALTSYLMKG